ncbi:MAG: DUF3853 family protein [Capnocytophaga sp.]|nr:DUF3853 family protein [Capnocytophaga sp.]
MININPHTPLWQLTVGEFIELQQHLYYFSAKKYEYGLKGLAKILGCSRSKAAQIKKSGILDEAISQNGKTIIIDREKALELFKNSK